MISDSDKIVIQFWGVRGTFPVPGKRSVRYGGNTNCVTLSFANQEFFIFDAGSGIKALSNDLVKNHQFPLSAKIFITHPHWDHINGIPLFIPLYMKGNEIEIFGPNHNDISMEKLISDQMNGINFPVTVKELAAEVKYRRLSEETFYINEIQVQTLFLTHPGKCLGYRIQYKGKIFCYITDNELYLKDSTFYNQSFVDRLVEFIYKANVLVIDATYRDEEYLKKVHWGHSCVSRVIEVADQAKVKTACLY
ncbi:MAG: MBL fold metallo-hydrolase, partial [Chlamydiales bacterium]